MRPSIDQHSDAVSRELVIHPQAAEIHSMHHDQAAPTLTSRVKTLRAHRIAIAFGRVRTFQFTQFLVLVLCYSIVLQPNAAVAAPSNHLMTLASVKEQNGASSSGARSAKSANRSDSPTLLNRLSNLFSSSAPEPPPLPPPVVTITDAVISRHKPTLGNGRIEGSLRVLLGESFTITNSSQLLGDLYLPGTPAIQLGTGAQHGGLVNDGGAASPANYSVSLNNNASLPGRIHTRADAIPLPADVPNSVPAATGTRSVTVRTQPDIAAIGNWQTVRDVNVAGSRLTMNMPPGNYGTLTVNGNSQVNFSAGIYNFANTINLDGSATLQSTGLVTINVAQDVTINSGALTLGSYTAPADVHLNVMAAILKINGSSQVSGMVRAYNATVLLNGTAQLRGQVIANTFTLNGGKVIGAVWPAQSGSSMTVFGPRRFDRTTGQPNQYVEQFSLPAGVTSPYTLHIQNGAAGGSSRVSSATIKLNGIDILTPSDLNQNVPGLDRTVTFAANNQLDVRLASEPGSYLIININGVIVVGDATPPSVAITAPATNTTTSESHISVSGTASDTGTGATGVAKVFVNDVEATYTPSNGSWSLADVPLNVGANQIVARAVDQAGNQATATVTVNRQAPLNHSPTVNAGADQNFTLPQTAALHGTATDDGLPEGSTLTTTWTMVSGEGTVTFTDELALNTTATFSTAGTYVLRLTASDTVLSSSDEITITVQPQNQPPTVTAGANQTIALPRIASLNGTVTDDGLPTGGTLSIAWTQVSGPGVVTFEDPTKAETTAAFSLPGTYVLRLWATDSDLTSAGELTIIVQPQNQAPTAAAGGDQIVTLPNFAQLNGTVSDDGWPADSTVSVQWTMVSGPAPVVFDNPNVTVTLARFSATGPYVLRLTAGDSELTNFDELTINVVLPADTTAPTLAITTPADHSTTKAETITVSGTVSDPGLYPSGVVHVTVNGVDATISPDGTWTLGNVALTVGTNSIAVHAVDNAGNPADQSISVTRQPPDDVTSPTLTITSPADGSTTQAETITVSGTVSDPGLYPSGVVHVTVNGVEAAISGDGTWTLGNVPLTVGSNSISVHAVDNAGNAADQSISVTRQPPPDTTAPTLAISSPADNSTTQAETITVSGTVSDPGQYASGVAQVTVNDVAASLDTASGTWTISNVPLPIVGNNPIVARATDAAGNPSTAQTMNVIRQPPPDVTIPTLAITSPTDGYSTQSETVTVSGTVFDPGQYASGVAQVTVNGATASLDTHAGTWTVSGIALAIGPTTITARAVDNAGNPATQSITINRTTPPDLQAPTITITSPANGFVTPDASITVTGIAIDEGAYATGVAHVLVNGQQAAYDPATHQWTASGVALNEGSNTIQVFADDNAPVPNAAQASINVTRHTPDTKAPTVTITSPIASLETYDATIGVAGAAVDDGLNATGVERVTINGVNGNYDAVSTQWSVPAVPLAYGDNDIVVIATDKAPTPNQGSAHIHVTRLRIPPPTITISNPQNGAVLAATSITVAGSVSSLGSTPTVTVNGENAVVSGESFTRTVSLAEGANTITIVATDSIAQQSQASLSVIRDLLAPAVSFANVPASVQPGGEYQILVDATDNVGVADVEFRVNGQHVATTTTAPYQFTLAVSTAYAAGTNLVLSAVARDLTNTTAVATAQTRTGGPGGISGYVFDDTTGYVLPGVSALLNNDGSMLTDELGVFNLISSTPSGVVRLSKNAHTPVERLYSVSIGEGTALFDARLTPLDSQANTIGVAGGTASGDSGRVQVSFAPGTFADAADIRVTSVSPQGLENLLPYGWSPIPGAVVDVRPPSGGVLGSQASVAPAHLTISQVSGLTSATPLTLARYDEVSHRWMVVSTGAYATPTADGGSLSADLPRLGQYAFLVADTGATAPPAPIVGQPLTAAAAADSAALDSAQASAVSTPRTAVFSNSARSAISFLATALTQLPSGVSIEATFGETYNLLGGRDSVLVDRPAQDFVLYAYPAVSAAQPNRLGAFFVAKPTRTDFTLTELFNANVHVEIRSGRQTKLGALIDGNGGGVRASDGSQLTIPAHALQGSQSVFFNDLPPNLANANLPEGYEIVGAFDLDLGSAALNASAVISVPGVGGDLSRIVVARLMTVGGQRSPKVVARGVADSNGKLNSTTTSPAVPAGVTLSGIRTSGRYLFIRVPLAFGYVKGNIVDGLTSNPLGMVKVSDNQTPFIDVTAADGQFVVVGAAGPDATGVNQLGAAALTTDATGKANASLDAQDAVAAVNISVSALPLGVESITPASNAQNMIATTPVTVTFNKPIAASSVTGSSFTLSTAAGNPVLGNITILAGNRVVVFTPAATLAASTSYKVSLSQSVRDIYGHPLAANFNSTFTTAATVTIGNRLRPEQIVIGYPDASGMSTISIPAQTVPEGSTLLVVNTTSGSTLSTVAGTSALSLQIQARVGDEITLIINQPDGTQYRVIQAAYRRADGFISVGSNGGTITSDDGQVLLSVPAGAISGQADIKLSRRAESDISIPREGDMDPANVPFGAGVRINVGGNFTNNQELHLEVAAPPTASEGQRVFFMRPAKFTDAGVEHDVWEVVTSGKTEGGKFKTMSPPYSGVTIVSNLPVADYDVFMPRTFRAVTGKVTELVPNHAPKPLANVACYIGPAQVIAYTAANGRFGTLDLRASAGDAALVVARDTLGRTETASATPYISTDPTETGLNGLQTLYASIQFPSSAGLPETLPALLHLEGRMLDLPEGQPDTLQAVGRVLLGSHLEIKMISTPDVQQTTGQLLMGGTTVQQLVWHRQAAEPGTGVLTTDFTVSGEGSYSVVVTTFTQSNVVTTRSTATFGFVALQNPNNRPPLEGPPRLVSWTPADGAQQVSTGTRIHLEFSEPVKNLIAGETVLLTDVATQQRISGKITSAGLPINTTSPNISTIDFQPDTGLEANKEYAIEVTSAVKDSNDHPLDQNYTAPDDTSPQPFRSTFTTFRPLVLTENPPTQNTSYRVATAGDLAITVSPTVNGSSLSVFDISDPQKPTVVGNKMVPFFATAYDIAEADQESDIITVETPVRRTYEVIAAVLSYSVQDSERPVNLWIYSLDDPASPELIGVSSLKIPRTAPSYPMYVKIHHKRAYVGNSGQDSLEVVDLAEAVHTLAESSDPKTAWFPAVMNGFNAGFNQDAKKQLATYRRTPAEAAPVYSLSVMDQAVPMPNGPTVQSPVVYVASNRLQLLSFDTNSSWDGRTTIVDTNPQDGIDDRLIGTKDLSPAGLAVDVRTAPQLTLNGQSTDIALLLGADRLWLFNVTNPRDPQAYPSRSFAEMGLGGGSARRMDVEDSLVYVMFADKVAVIDFSDPAHPYVNAVITDLGSDLRWISVRDGFVYTLDLSAGANGISTSRVRSSIGAAAAVVYVHGADGSSCTNPVLINRANDHMMQAAETVFKIYGHDAPQSKQVIIRKETRTGDQIDTQILATLTPTIESAGSNGVVIGRATWPPAGAIDAAAIYTAEVVIDAGLPTEFRSRRAPIVFSHLIDQFEDVFGVRHGDIGGKFAYILGANALVSMTVNNNPVNLENAPLRSYGLHVENIKLSDLNNLPVGRYQFKLTASLQGDAAVTEEAEGLVIVENDKADNRQPGSIVVGGVEVESGNLGLSHADIPEIKNRGLSLSLTRFYNSRGSNTYNSMGYGWAHNYQVLLKHGRDLENPSDSIYTVESGDGTSPRFKASKLADTPNSEAPYHDTLRKNGDNSFDYFTKANIKYHFNQVIEVASEQLFNQGYMGNLSYIEEPNGNRLTLSYDTQGRLGSVSDSANRKLIFTYEQGATPFVGTLDTGATNNDGLNCTNKRFLRSLRRRFALAQLGVAWRVLKITGPGGLEIDYQYDDKGNLERAERSGFDGISQATGTSVWQYAYDPLNGTNASTEHLLKSVQSPNHTSGQSHVTTYEYETTIAGWMIKASHMPESVNNSYNYSFSFSNISRVDVTDGRGNATHYGFHVTEDSDKTRPQKTVTVTAPREAVSTIVFDGYGNKLSETDPEARQTTTDYDNRGNAVSQSISGQGKTITTSATYDPTFSKPLTTVDGEHNLTTYSLDGRGNITRIQLPTGRVQQMDYAANGDLSRMVDQYGFSSTYQYDPYGNQTVISRQAGGQSMVVMHNTYDSRSRLLTSDDTLAPTVENTYDALDHIVSQTVTDPANIRDALSTTVSYLREGQAQQITQTGGLQTLQLVNTYDALNRLVKSVETPNGAGPFTLLYTYDANSNLLTETNRRGVTTTRAYDALNFLMSETLSGPFGQSLSTMTATDVDRIGNPISIVNLYGQATTFEYDGLHRLIRRTVPGGFTEETAYDDNSNVTLQKDRNQRATTFAYDPVNRRTRLTDPAGHVTTWLYDDAQRITTRHSDPQGLTETLQSDGLGRTVSRQIKFGGADYVTTSVYNARSVSTTDPRGTVRVNQLSAFGETGDVSVTGANPAYRVRQSYAAFGGLKHTVDPNGRETTYTLDGLNRATLINHTGGFSESFNYDGAGNVLSHTDLRGAVSQMTYDNLGRPLATVVQDGVQQIPVVTIAYQDALSKETRADADGHATELVYDGLRRLKSVKNAAGDTRTMQYDGMDLRQESDYKGKTTTYLYDPLDRVTEITDRLGQVTNIVNSDNGGYTKSVTNRRGFQRTEVYDPLQRLQSVAQGGAPLVAYEYDGQGNRTAMRDGLGNLTAYTYDKLNRVTAVNHPGNLQTETFAYDAVGNLVTYNDGAGADVTQVYDELNHLKTKTDGAGNTTKFKYDGGGLLLEQTRPKGAEYKTAYLYNALGSLKRVTDAKAGAWEFTYDGTQNLTSIKDALERTVSYGYDTLNRLHTITQPHDLVTTYGYDENSNRTSVTDPKGQQTSIAYDDLDRATTVAYSQTTGKGPRNYVYNYDPEGNLIGVAETVQLGAANPTTRNYTRSYDARDRLTAATDPYNHVVRFDYDAANNLKLLTDAASKQTRYVYDVHNRLQTVTLPNLATIDYTWAADGLLKRVAYPSGMQRDYDYDQADRLTSVKNHINTTESEEFDYSYDANSNRTAETRLQNGRTNRAVTYDYDLLDRLTDAGYTTLGQRPANPAAGQSSSYTQGTAVTGFDYDATGNRKTATVRDRTTTITLTTDAQGETTESRQINDGQLVTTSAQFDDLNRLIQLSSNAAGAVPTNYAYDRNGNLISTSQNNQVTAGYEYDARDQLRRVVNGANQEFAGYDYDCERQRLGRTVEGASLTYVYGRGQVVNEFSSNNQLANRYDLGASEVVRAELGGEGERYYFSDAQGSITALAQLTQSPPASLTARYEYDAWGNYLGSSGASYNSIGYTGQRVDSETGLMPLGNGERYYSPGLGSFIQQDSFTGMAMMAQSMNRYAYAHNNPLRYIDRNGHGVWSDLWEGAKATGSALLEPLKQAADVVTAGGARLMGIDAEDVQLSSSMGKREQKAILAGESPDIVAAKTVDSFTKNYQYTLITLGFGPLTEKVGGATLAYYDGNITLSEYNQRMGSALADVSIMAGGAIFARVGNARAASFREGVTDLAAKRAPLSDPAGFQPELPFEPAANVGPRQPGLPFEESLGPGAAGAAEESFASGLSRQMRLPFDGPEPEQLAFEFSAKSVTRTGVQANKAAGDAWEAEVLNNELPKTQTDIQAQITIRSHGPSRLRVRLDALGTDEAGAIRMTDAKGSQTAPFTRNQEIVYPELETHGGVVVGKGKAPYTGGTEIPPTKVDIIRRP